MTRKNEPPVFIRLSPLQVKKIEVMRESLDAPVTRKEMIDDLIDGGENGCTPDPVRRWTHFKENLSGWFETRS